MEPESTKMLSFQEFTKEISISFWDIDDTLLKTVSNVYVVKGNERVRALNSKEFNTYQLKRDEKYDFSEFKDSEHFANTSTPYSNLIRLAKRILKNYHKASNNSKLVILTARENFDDREKAIEAFKGFGLPLTHIDIEYAGELNMPAHKAKKFVVNKYLQKGQFNIVNLFDDQEKNLDAFLTLEDKYPKIIFNGFLAYDGELIRYN